LLERQQKILFHHSTGDLQADRRVYDQVTVASEIVVDPSLAPDQIDRAIVAMLTFHRPIYLEVAQNVWTQACAEPRGTLAPVPIASNPKFLASAIAAAWGRIAGARAPVLWFGVEIQRYGLQDLAQKLVDASGLPFTTTSLGKTVLDESQSAFIGTYAGPASPLCTREVMAACDCPIALGAIITDDYLGIMASGYEEMIAVNDEYARVGDVYFAQVTLKAFLEGLIARCEADPAFPRRWTPLDVGAEDEEPAPAGQLTYNRLFRQLTAFLADRELLDESVLVLGESTSLYVFGNLFGLPANAFVGQAAWGSLGHETGCALGVALGSGKRPWVVAGDGGFMMICQEISSLARAGVNAAIFVMSNRGYAIEQAFVDIKAFTPEGAFAPFDVLPAWDYCALAKAFGAEGFRVRTEEELAAALDAIEGLEDVPALVEVVIPEKDLAPQLARLAAPPPTLRKYGRSSPD
jgi:indolepyruvate decarboxylase